MQTQSQQVWRAGQSVSQSINRAANPSEPAGVVADRRFVEFLSLFVAQCQERERGVRKESGSKCKEVRPFCKRLQALQGIIPFDNFLE